MSKKEGQPTHQEIKMKKEQDELQELYKSETYKKINEVFPDIKLVSIKEKEE